MAAIHGKIKIQYPISRPYKRVSMYKLYEQVVEVSMSLNIVSTVHFPQLAYMPRWGFSPTS